MASSHQGALSEISPVIAKEKDMRLSLPEATMFIIGTSGFLWALLYGAFQAFLG